MPDSPPRSPTFPQRTPSPKLNVRERNDGHVEYVVHRENSTPTKSASGKLRADIYSPLSYEDASDEELDVRGSSRSPRPSLRLWSPDLSSSKALRVNSINKNPDPTPCRAHSRSPGPKDRKKERRADARPGYQGNRDELQNQISRTHSDRLAREAKSKEDQQMRRNRKSPSSQDTNYLNVQASTKRHRSASPHGRARRRKRSTTPQFTGARLSQSGSVAGSDYSGRVNISVSDADSSYNLSMGSLFLDDEDNGVPSADPERLVDTSERQPSIVNDQQLSLVTSLPLSSSRVAPPEARRSRLSDALQITTDIVGNILEAVVEAVVPSLPTTKPISKAIRYATPQGLVAAYRAVVRTSPPGETISAALGKINIQQVSEQIHGHMTRIIIVEENAANSNKHNSVNNEKSNSSLEDELRMIKDGFGNFASITMNLPEMTRLEYHILPVYLNMDITTGSLHRGDPKEDQMLIDHLKQRDKSPQNHENLEVKSQDKRWSISSSESASTISGRISPDKGHKTVYGPVDGPRKPLLRHSLLFFDQPQKLKHLKILKFETCHEFGSALPILMCTDSVTIHLCRHFTGAVNNKGHIEPVQGRPLLTCHCNPGVTKVSLTIVHEGTVRTADNFNSAAHRKKSEFNKFGVIPPIPSKKEHKSQKNSSPSIENNVGQSEDGSEAYKHMRRRSFNRHQVTPAKSKKPLSLVQDINQSKKDSIPSTIYEKTDLSRVSEVSKSGVAEGVTTETKTTTHVRHSYYSIHTQRKSISTTHRRSLCNDQLTMHRRSLGNEHVTAHNSRIYQAMKGIQLGIPNTCATTQLKVHLLLFDVEAMHEHKKQVNWERLRRTIDHAKLRASAGVICSSISSISEQVLSLDIDYVISNSGCQVYRKGRFSSTALYPISSFRQHEGEKTIQRLVNFILYYIGWLSLPVRRGRFVDISDTQLTICPVGNGGSCKDYEEFIQIDKRASIRSGFILALKNQFRDTDLIFSLCGDLEIRVSPLGWDHDLTLTSFDNESFTDVIIFSPQHLTKVDDMLRSSSTRELRVKHVTTASNASLDKAVQVVMSVL